MTDESNEAVSDSGSANLAIKTIDSEDIKEALRRGFDDFLAMPTHVVLIIIIYPAVGIVLARMTFGYDLLPMLFPLMAGFTLIGPLAAVGLYELSRRRELGLEVTWRKAFEFVKSPSTPSILMVGLIQLMIYFAWLGTAQSIYYAIYGEDLPVSIIGFFGEVLTTPSGWALILVGCGVGFVFAVGVLAISVVSFPLLLDREDVSAVQAIETSVRSVMQNPKTMALWGLIVAVSLAIGSLPFFVGLAVVMPVLGHSTWHLYRRVVER